ncbi:MAG: helix-turn-helix domain-containing protein [Oscillospiraceae bacterium]|nr:helix-turn-helix domain-containing protein [Oscillospiraceae bacterium]
MNIGTKIKELRKKQDVTQEKLADYLNLSYQAVSKWENGLAYPDITLVPALANFFGVSADELLGLRCSEDDEEFHNYSETYKNNGNQGKVAENIELCRKVIEKHPRSFKWISNLARSLMSHYYHKYGGSYGDKSKVIIDEVILLCERIREDCTINELRHDAMQMLVFAYSEEGKHDFAVNIADEMPTLWISKEILLACAKEGEECVCQEQDNLMNLIDLSDQCLRSIATHDEKLSADDKIKIYETRIKLFDLIFDGIENTLFYNSRVYSSYYCLAEIYCGDEHFDTEKVLENLLLCEAAIIRYEAEEAGTGQKYKPVFLNKQKTNPSKIVKNYEHSLLKTMYDYISDDLFNKVRNHPEFITLMARLEGAK